MAVVMRAIQVGAHPARRPTGGRELASRVDWEYFAAGPRCADQRAEGRPKHFEGAAMGLVP